MSFADPKASRPTVTSSTGPDLVTPKRFAIYYMPPSDAPWARFATRWLGWDAETGTEPPAPDVPGLPHPREEITATPRKYGLHATMKPPFRLAKGATRDDLEAAAEALAARSSPVTLDSLALTRLGRFLALCPTGDQGALGELAGKWVSELDAFRAPPEEEELARRRAGGLTAAQEENLLRWGYPYVMESFRFHITLSGRLSPADLDATANALETQLGDLLPAPFTIDTLAIAGEGEDGRFRLLRRLIFTG